MDGGAGGGDAPHAAAGGVGGAPHGAGLAEGEDLAVDQGDGPAAVGGGADGGDGVAVVGEVLHGALLDDGGHRLGIHHVDELAADGLPAVVDDLVGLAVLAVPALLEDGLLPGGLAVVILIDGLVLGHGGHALIEDHLGAHGDLHRILRDDGGHHLQRAGAHVQAAQERLHRLLPGNGGDRRALGVYGHGFPGAQQEVSCAADGEELPGGIRDIDFGCRCVLLYIGILQVQGAGVGIAGVGGQGECQDGESRYCCDSDQPLELDCGFLASFKHDT